jgi:GTPase SAR1 family protein
MFVFSVVDKKSLNRIKELYQTVKETKEINNIPGIIVANKIDLTDERCISTEEGKKLADGKVINKKKS